MGRGGITLIFGLIFALGPTSAFCDATAEEQVAPMPSLESCQAGYALLHSKLFKRVEQVYRDVEHQTQWIYHERLGAMFRGMDPKDVHDVFSQVDEATFNEIFHANLGGYLRQQDGSDVRGMQERFLQDLKDFAEDTGGVFWKYKDKQYLLTAIHDALNEIDKRNTGEDVNLEDIGGHTEKAVVKAEDAILTRGQHDTSKPAKGEFRPKYDPLYRKLGVTWDPIVRFFWPLYPRAQKVVDFFSEIRARMQHAFKIDKVVIAAALDRAEELKYTKQELVRLKYLLANTGEQIADARQDIQDVIGHELSSVDPLRANQVNLYKLGKGAEGYKAGAEYLEDQLQGEADLDKMHEVVDSAMQRKGQGPRTVKNFVEDELRFRHMQYDREAGTTQRRHASALARDSDVSFNVDYRWTVTYTYYNRVTTKDKDGKTHTSLQYSHTDTITKSDTVKRVPDYEDILRDSFDTSPGPTSAPARFNPRGTVNSSISGVHVTGTPGLERIRNDTVELRRSTETPFWDYLSARQQQIYGWIQDHPKLFEITEPEKRTAAVTARAEEIKRAKTELEGALARFTPYSDWNEKQVAAQWRNDNYRDFQARNDTLAARYRNLIKFHEIFEEQARRPDTQKAQLRILYSSPDYTQRLEVMRKRMIRDNWIKGITGGILGLGAAGGGGAYAYFANQEPTYEELEPEEEKKAEEEVLTETDLGFRDAELEALKN